MDARTELLTLQIRNLIAAREANTAAAKRELEEHGKWSCERDYIDSGIARKIYALFEQAGVAGGE